MGSVGEVAYDIVAKDKTAEGLTSASDRARQVSKIAGAAMTGIGVSTIALTDSARKTNATIRTTALQLGVTAEEMRELTLATTNVTFQISEVTASFDLLTRAGMINAKEIAATATIFDTLGDATGKSASQITTMMIPAFNAFGIPLEDAALHIDTLTHLTRNTTIEMSDFAGGLNYLAADIGALGLTMIDYVAILELMADRGIQGSAATRELRTAVSGANGDLATLYRTLGFTAPEVETYSARINEATGLTQEMADAQNTQYGIVDKLKQSVSELTLQYGSLLEPVESLGPIFAGMGPILIALSAGNWTLAASIKTATIATWAWTTALLANPITWIALAIVGVTAAVVGLAWKVDLLSGTTRELSGEMSTLDSGFESTTKKLLKMTKATTKADFSFIDLSKALGVAIPDTRMIELTDSLTTAIINQNPAIAEYERLLDETATTADDFRDAQEALGDSAREVGRLTTAYNDLSRAMSILEDSAENISDQERTIEHATWGVKDAQEAYNKAVTEYGSSSDEALRANLRLRDAEDALSDAERNRKDMINEVKDAEIEQSRVLEETGAKGLADLKTILNDEKTKYETIESEITALRQLEKENRDAIREAEKTAEIQIWQDLRDEIEANPIEAEIYIRKYVTTEIEGGIGLIPGPLYGLGDITAELPVMDMPPSRTLYTAGTRPPIEVHMETTIYNYSDVEEMQRMVAEAAQMGIDDAYGMA